MSNENDTIEFSLPYEHLGVYLTTGQLTALGAFLFNCSGLENLLTELVSALADLPIKFPESKYALITPLLFRTKLEKLSDLSKALPKENKQFQSDLKAFISEAKQIYQIRNKVSHAVWDLRVSRESLGGPITLEAVAKSKPRLRDDGAWDDPKELTLTVKKLEKHIESAFKAMQDCRKLRKTALQIHEKRREKQRASHNKSP